MRVVPSFAAPLARRRYVVLGSGRGDAGSPAKKKTHNGALLLEPFGAGRPLYSLVVRQDDAEGIPGRPQAHRDLASHRAGADIAFVVFHLELVT